MKILHVVPSFGLGGMEKVICVLIEKTSDCHKHEILALDGYTQASRWIKDSKVRFVGFTKPSERSRYFQALYRSLREIHPELLMTYNWGATDAVWLGHLAGIQHIIHSEHGFNADEGRATVWKRDMVRFLVYRLTSKVVVVSRELLTMLRQRFFLKANRVRHIPNGIDTSTYAPNLTERQQVRKTLGFAESDVVIGFSGRLDPIKNLLLLVKIFVCCVQNNRHFRLLIVGDGPEKKSIETFCREKNLCNSIVLTGQQDSVLPYLRAMDVFVLTSLREQMPMTVLEAMAVGIPLVATHVGEIPYIIDDGINGFVRDVNAPVGAFAQPILDLLCQTRRGGMGSAARQKIIHCFQQELMVRQYKAVLQDLS
jgi:sugar transferase (PEP-CTERM/EpsH1 system associated)